MVEGPLFSIIICTYGRKRLLRLSLQSVCRQEFYSSDFEIIVVDNNPSNKIFSLVMDFRKLYPQSHLVYVLKKEKGLGRARNAGLEHCRGDYVGFLDDDAKADKKWLLTAALLLQKVRPKPKVIGGPYKIFYLSTKPRWFKDKYEIRNWGVKPRFLAFGESFSGSNVFFEKAILEKYGGFDERVGMIGTDLSLGEETSLFEKIWKKGKDSQFYYSPNLIIYHAVLDFKMTVSYQLKRCFAAGQALAVRRNNSDLPFFIFLRVTVYFLGFILFTFFALVRVFKYSFWQNWLIEEFDRPAYCLGFVSRSFNFIISFKQKNS